MQEAYDRAEGLLDEIAMLRAQLATVEKIAADAVRAAARPYAGQAVDIRKRIGAAERALSRLSKDHKQVFFDGRDRVDLKNGALLYKVVRTVKRARGLLARLKARGGKEGIRTIEKVDWEALEKWSDAALADIGTERKKVELFEYELK